MLCFPCQLFLLIFQKGGSRDRTKREHRIGPIALMKEWDKNYYFRFIETDQSNFGLISTYGHYEDWQPVSIVYPEKESRFIKKGKT